MDEERATTLFYYGITNARYPHALPLPGPAGVRATGAESKIAITPGVSRD